MALTLLWLWCNGFLPKLQLPTITDNDRDLRAVFLVRRNVHNFRDDVFIPTDHPTKHNVFACWKDQSVIRTNGRYSGWHDLFAEGKYKCGCEEG